MKKSSNSQIKSKVSKVAKKGKNVKKHNSIPSRKKQVQPILTKKSSVKNDISSLKIAAQKKMTTLNKIVRRRRLLNKSQEQELKKLYKSGTSTLKDLCKKFKISTATLYNYIKR